MIDLYIDAICGAGFPSPAFAEQAVKTGLARYTGNQWVMRWEWDREALTTVDERSLQALYEGIKEIQHAGK